MEPLEEPAEKEKTGNEWLKLDEQEDGVEEEPEESEETQTTSAPLLASWDLMLENSSTTSPHFQSPR